jgi:hypothetical protein
MMALLESPLPQQSYWLQRDVRTPLINDMLHSLVEISQMGTT